MVEFKLASYPKRQLANLRTLYECLIWHKMSFTLISLIFDSEITDNQRLLEFFPTTERQPPRSHYITRPIWTII